MKYAAALSRAWSELEDIARERNFSVRFLREDYSVDLENKQVILTSRSIPAKERIAILILHYIRQKLAGLPLLSGEWISFRQLKGGQGYYPVFKKRVIEPIAGKYAACPEAILEPASKFGARRIQLADAGIVFEAFEGVCVLICLWRGEEDLAAEANILFDKSISHIFCTEDVVILAEIIARSL